MNYNQQKWSGYLKATSQVQISADLLSENWWNIFDEKVLSPCNGLDDNSDFSIHAHSYCRGDWKLHGDFGTSLAFSNAIRDEHVYYELDSGGFICHCVLRTSQTNVEYFYTSVYQPLWLYTLVCYRKNQTNY